VRTLYQRSPFETRVQQASPGGTRLGVLHNEVPAGHTARHRFKVVEGGVAGSPVRLRFVHRKIPDHEFRGLHTAVISRSQPVPGARSADRS